MKKHFPSVHAKPIIALMLPLFSTHFAVRSRHPEVAGKRITHGFASYHLAHFKNAAATALELGHHDSRITFAHYRELVRPKEAERYWQIKPAGRGAKVVPLVQRG
jgi:hypothetical protein